MDAVGAANAQGLALFKGAAAADLAQLADVFDNDIGSLDQLIAQGGVAQIGAGHAVVHPAAWLGLALGHLGVDILSHIGEERDNVMVGDGLDGVNLFFVELGVLANPRGLFARDANLAHLGVGLAGEHFDLLPDGVLVLKGEDVSHFGASVAVDHRRLLLYKRRAPRRSDTSIVA